MPQWKEPLLEEVLTQLPEWGDIAQANLNNLRVMDSFLKESQRFNPPGEREWLATVFFKLEV